VKIGTSFSEGNQALFSQDCLVFFTLSLYTHSYVHKSTMSSIIKIYLLQPYIVAVYHLRMCMKEDNPSPNYFKRDK